MKTIFKLAFRNIGRNRRRSFLAFISVALSLMMIVCLQGWIEGIMNSMVKNYTKNETGHIRIATRSFDDKSKFHPVTENISNPQKIIERVKKNQLLSKEISQISPRITFRVLLNNDGKNVAAMAFAGDPENEKNLLMLNDCLLPRSKYISGPRETIIGQTIAERLGFKVGDTIKIVASGTDYALRMKKMTVVGIFKTGINALDENAFQLPIESAKELLGMTNSVQQIIVMLKDWRKSDQVAAQIRLLIPESDLSVKSWTGIGDYYRLVKMSEGMYRFIYLVVAFLGAFIICNIMMMVVMERRKEIGILKSMGMTRREVLFLFLTEGVLLGLAGSVLGTSVGWIIITVLGNIGVDITSMMQSMKMPIDNIIYPHISAPAIVGSILLGTLVAAIVSLLPSRQASSMNAVDAIKSV